MSIENLPIEIKKVFMKELEQLVNKYSPLSSYPEEKINTALFILEQFGNKDLVIEELIEVLNLLNQFNEQVVEYYLWIREHNNDAISIEAAQKHIEELHREGYIMLSNYVMYLDESNQEMKRALIEQMLTDTYEIDRLFDKDEIIQMWLNETPQEDTIKELLQLGLEELVEEPPEEAYASSDGATLYYIAIY